MIKTKNIIIIFIPALLILGIAIFIRILQYQSIKPSPILEEEQNTELQIPILSNDPILGNKKAPISIMVFEDFGCEGCRQQMTILEKLLEKHEGKVKIIWKGLPVARFPYSSQSAHEHAFCANQQENFAKFEQLAFSNSNNLSAEILNRIVDEIGLNKNKLQKCLNSGEAQAYIKQTESLGLYLNIQSVPSIFIDNKQIQPPQILEGWETLLGL